MDSILYRIYGSWFSPPDQGTHRAAVLKNRMRESLSTYSSLLDELEKMQQEKVENGAGEADESAFG